MGEYWYLYFATFLMGLLCGAVFPLGIAYLIYFVKKRRRIKKSILGPLLLKILLFIIIIYLVIALFGLFSFLIYPYVGEDETNSFYTGIGLLAGLIAGIIFLLKGFKKGQRSKEEHIKT